MTNLPLVAYVLLTLYVVLFFSSNFSFHLRAASLLFIFRRKITSKLSSPGPDLLKEHTIVSSVLGSIFCGNKKLRICIMEFLTFCSPFFMIQDWLV